MKTGETYGPIKGVDEHTQPEHNQHGEIGEKPILIKTILCHPPLLLLKFKLLNMFNYVGI